MPPLNLLIKPASGRCNLRCRYCFYADESAHRQIDDYGLMPEDVLEEMIRKALLQAEGACTFGFQGGEPTLRGLDFFRKAVEMQNKYNVHGVRIENALQTNGTLLNEEWAAFFAQNKFLIGLSLDGMAGLHNKNRLDARGEGTLRRVLDAANLLKKHDVTFNILTVVTNATADKIDLVYDFFARHDLRWQQYIPCLDAFGENQGWLTADKYAQFLCRLFDRWADDVMHGRFIYIRQFENYLGMLLGRPAENCGMMGCCGMQYTVEADGGVYPCDFYVLDAYRLGNFMTDDFAALDAKRKQLCFVEDSMQKDAQCLACAYYPLCRGGCRRDRDDGSGQLSRTRFCSAYRQFFEYALPKLQHIAAHCAARK